MDFVTGNLLDMAENGEFDVIVHGCNCFHAMGGGIARQIADRYPEVKEADFATKYGSKKKLGEFSYARVSKGKDNSAFIVVNAYTQHKWSGVRDVFEYKAFDTLLNRLCGFLYALHEHKGDVLNVGFPKIGCGLARGNEDRIMGSLNSFSGSISPWGCVKVVSLDTSHPVML
jgi:O-acetyl-ADP-ribose deacetylase (regulator of RNase III)